MNENLCVFFYIYVFYIYGVQISVLNLIIII